LKIVECRRNGMYDIGFINPNIIHEVTVKNLLFFIPGVTEMLRVNGPARIVTRPEILELFTVNGRKPSVALLVETAEETAPAPKRRTPTRRKAAEPVAAEASVEPAAEPAAEETAPAPKRRTTTRR
jgi:hypothetical protein